MRGALKVKCACSRNSPLELPDLFTCAFSTMLSGDFDFDFVPRKGCGEPLKPSNGLCRANHGLGSSARNRQYRARRRFSSKGYCKPPTCSRRTLFCTIGQVHRPITLISWKKRERERDYIHAQPNQVDGRKKTAHEFNR